MNFYLMFHRFSILAFLALITLPVFAQKPALVFHHLSVDDGLSENTVRAIIEDDKGYMWFGSEDGLNRYDGYEFVSYHSDKNENTTLSSRNIKVLFKDSKKRLWILTSNGINIYDPLLDIFYNSKNDKYVALKPLSGDISGILEDPKGNIWVTTVDDGLFKIESLTKPAKRINYPYEDMSKHLYTMYMDGDTSMWVGTRDGLLKYNIVTGTFSDYRPNYGRGYEIRYIYRDDSRNLWLCTSNGLKIISADGKLREYLYDLNNPEGISGNNILSLSWYKEDTYLLTVDGGGVDMFNVKTQKFYHYKDELSSTNVNSLYIDSKGDIWVGTYLNGINYSNATTNLFVLKKNNLYSPKSIREGIVTSFLKDSRGDFWVATDGGGLYRRKKGSENFIQYKIGDRGLSSNALIRIMEDDQGYVWISTYGGGVNRYDRAADIFKVYKPNAAVPGSLFNDHTKALQCYNGDIWISGFGAGVDVLRKSTGKFEHFFYDKNTPTSLASDWVQSFYVDKSGTLWLCTFRGLCKYVPETNSFKNYLFKIDDSPNQVDINSVLDIVEDDRGNLWFGTMGSGLVCFNKEKEKYSFFTTKDGLSNNCVKTVIADDYLCLWLATNNGITKFDMVTHNAKAYTTKDGIPPCSFYLNSKYKDELGRIYFGTNNGYMVINPLLTAVNKRIPPIVITKFKIFNQLVLPRSEDSPLKVSITDTKEIILPYSQNALTFEFSALNFNSSRNNQYAYWLEGFDETWFYAGSQRVATYTNLPPGTYVFRVKGSNNDKVWNEKGAAIRIVILPPFWATWWFNTLLVLLLLMVLYFIYTWRVRSINNKNIELEETVKTRTVELKEANEQLETFVYRASHDIKGPLKSIIGLTTIGKKDIKDPTAQEYFDHILLSTQKLDNLLMDLIQLTRVKRQALQLDRIDFNAMISEVMTSFQNIPHYDQMKFTINVDDTGEFYSDKKLLHSIIQNITENAIKYSDASKAERTLHINIVASKKGAEMSFKDNGIGISHELQKNIFEMFYKADEKANGSGLGLYIVKSTVEQLGGTIRVESQQGSGTTFFVKL